MTVRQVLAPMAAAASPYPPTPGRGSGANASRAGAARCVSFTGHGFAANGTVTITDNGEAEASGTLRMEVFFGADAEWGKHILAGSGEVIGATLLCSERRHRARRRPARCAAT